MKRILIITAILFSVGQLYAQSGLGEVMGTIVGEDEFGIPSVHVSIEDSGVKYQIKTDIDGRFRISGIPAGECQLILRQGVDTMFPILVTIPADGFHDLGRILFVSKLEIRGPIICFVSIPWKLIDGSLPIKSISTEGLKHSAVRFDMKKLVASVSTDVRQTEDESLVFRGARKGDVIYLVDGIKTREDVSVPSVGINKVKIYTGGLPAKFGDTLGGIVVIESKSYFDLYREWQAAQLKARYY